MSTIVVPQLGESIVEARVARWLKKEGDAVTTGEPLVELETDKINVEVGAPQAGVLATITQREGADVKIGDVLGTVEQASAGAAKPAAEATAANGAAAPVAAKPAAPPPGAKPAAKSGAEPAEPAEEPAAEQELEPPPASAPVAPSHPRTVAPSPASAAPSQLPPVAPSPVVPSPRPVRSSDRSEERRRMSKRRQTIARRLVEAQRTAAMLTTFNEVDMTAVMEIRKRQKESFTKAHGVGLGIASFFVKASIAALRAFPQINAELQGDEIVMKHYYDIGIAVGAEGGLVVPVLRDADRMSFPQMEVAIRDFATRAGDGSLTLEDLMGGTFTITNGGVFGSLLSTPILNPPQVGILGLHKIQDRPVAMGGQVTIRPMMYVALSYDHRIVDGREAVQFLVMIKDLVEEPANLLLVS
jgi:2-oxoglutarate dehydrogenase E2 component (dihydrolipoamide succinyltransferase)